MIKQMITYNSPNQYFAGFIQQLINITRIDASVSISNGTITLWINNHDRNLQVFDTNISKYLPYSIFLGEIETSEVDEAPTSSQFKSLQYNIAPCNKCLEMLNDPSSTHYLDESLKCDHYSNSIDKTYEDYTIFSPHYSKNSAVLITDATKINDLFIVTEDEIKALFSIEKPTLKVTINDEVLKELTGKNYIYIKAPYNNRSALAAINAKESGVDYLFFEDMNDLKIVIVQKNTTIIQASRVATPLEKLDIDTTISRFLNIKKEAGFEKGAIGANLSTKGISFLASNELGSKKVITFQEFSLEKLLENFQNDTKRSKLYTNFQSKYPDVVKELESNLDLGLFETISVILELKEKGFEALSDKGYEFRGNGGLKIDTNYVSEGFDYDSFIGSIISFKLADVDTHYLAYSIFEALGDMAINTLNQLKEKFKITDIIMMGDMFSNSVLYSRILSKYQLSNPYFSKAIALDE
jgi:hypothetical protein